MQSADPCVECGGNALKLIDGYYYCVECGTQNTNVRETVVEQKTLGDGTFALATRRKILKSHDSKIQMSAEWYKWHAYNFVILGLADELVAAGAKPTFKLKLLWIWTRYIKKYQNKDALGFEKNDNEEGNNENLTLPSFLFQENSNSNAAPNEEDDEQDTENEQKNKKINKNEILDGSKRDIKFLSKSVIIAMLYLALNLDKSDIQLYHILRFIKEKRLNFSNIQRFLPDDIDVKSIQEEWLKFIHSKVCNMHNLRALAMSLLRKLDLGTPKVPDMRQIIDDFLLELCLPNDIKPMIYSLMFFHRCDFLDISSRSKAHLVHTPDYEGVAMSYVLVALKMCFGLDGDYEEKLSDAVERINDERNLSKSYRMGKYSEPSTRLFSFREWCSYVQFRKITLCKSCLHMAEHHYLDTDDNVFLEHMSDRPQTNKDLKDETAINLISKIPEEDEGRVIPKSKFLPTLTPMTDYTEIIIEHNQDQEIRELLSEDFTQYSLNYACEYLELVGTNSDNIIKGVSEGRKTFSKVILGTIVTKKSNKQMIYVKNCENRNWMITNPPKMEHVISEDVQNVSNDKESDHGYDSEILVSEKDVSKETENVGNTDQSINEDIRLVYDSVDPVNEKEDSSKTGNVYNAYQSTNEDMGLVYDSEDSANEKEHSGKTGNVDNADQSMNEDIRLVYDSEDPVNEKEDSSVTGHVDNPDQSTNEDIRLVYDSEDSVNEKDHTSKIGHVDDADQSMNEYKRLVYDSEDPVNEKEDSSKTGNVDNLHDDVDQSINEDTRLVYDSEDSADEKEQSGKTGNLDNADQSMNEDIRLVFYSEGPVNEKEDSVKTGNVDDTDQSMNENIKLVYDSEDPANEKVDPSKTGNVDDAELSMNEDIRLVYDSEDPVNKKGVSIDSVNIDDIDQNMTKFCREVNSENLANEKEVSEVHKNLDDIDQSMEDVSDLEKLAKEKEGTENIVDLNDQHMKGKQRRFIITEEDNDKNIFDDTFEELDIKDEMEQSNGEDGWMDVNNENFQEPIPNNESHYDDRASISDFSDDDTLYATFNPDTFDREQTIKELILNACKKYKIPIPQEYKPPKEPRKRKADISGNEETPREPRKRAKINRFEMKRKVDELISGYHNLKQIDLISQMQEAVSLAIQRNQLDSESNVRNVTQIETANLTVEQASDALTRTNSNITGIVENQSNINLQNKSIANTQMSILEQTDMEQNPDKTVEEDEIIDETWESKLFEGEEEIKIDDLVPKGDPKFDEEKYDVNQLYIKIKTENEDTLEDVPHNLEEILNKKIEQCKHSTEFEKLKPQPLSVKPVKTKYESDSEDELPLHVLQEEKKLIEEKIAWEDNFEPLINEANVKEFNYWFRHYDEDFMNKSQDWHKKFDEELKENTPSSFYFVIRECAAILNCSTFTLYKHMQALEKYIIARAKYQD